MHNNSSASIIDAFELHVLGDADATDYIVAIVGPLDEVYTTYIRPLDAANLPWTLWRDGSCIEAWDDIPF